MFGRRADGSLFFDTVFNSDGFNQGVQNIGNSVLNLKSTFLKLGASIGLAFSTKELIEASAGVNALNSQLEQTFGNLKSYAENAMQTVAKESGIVETRLQSVGTSIYAFAKASGMDSASALNMMQEALQVTADSAAYYDRSLEETAESLKSFLKGNYANDAALGISCTETTRNIAANKLYGKSFQELSEAQKQLTLLQMVKDANQLSGAMGQASREADGWENVTGNLKEAWKQFLAVVGQPVLQVATQIVKNLSSALQNLTNYAKQTTNALSKVFGWDFGEDTSDKIVSNIADSTEVLIENLDEADKSAKKLQKNLAGFDKLNILNSEEQESSKTEAPADLSSLTALENTAESTENTVDSIKNKLLGLFKNTGLESFFSEIKKGFDSVNWRAVKSNVDGIFSDLRPIAKTSLDGVVKIAKSSMTTFGKVIGGTVSVTGKSLQTVTGGIAKWLDADKEKISNGIKEISDNLSSGIDNIGIFFDSIFGTLGASIDRMRPTMENAIAVFLGGFSDLGLAVGRIFSSAFDIATGILAQWAVSNEETIGAFFDNVQGTFAQVAELLGGIMTEISEILTGWWYNGGAVVWGEICRAVTDIGTTVMNVYNEWIQPAIDTVIGIVSDLWEYTLRPIFEQVISVATKIGECVAALWSNVLSPVVNWLVEVLAPVVKNVLNVIRGVFQTVFKVIGDIISGFLKALGGITDFLTNVFKGNWKKAFQSIFDVLDGILQMVIGVIKGAFNLVIDALNALISAVYSVFSTVANIIGKASGIIGNVFGQDWSFEMPTEAPLIPKLATGTVVPASYGEFMAILGDNKREPEIVSPVSAMKQAFKEAMAEMNFTQASNGETVIVLELDGEVVFKKNVQLNQKYKKRHGGRSAFA